ncbi:MAG: outer membrane protein assembly factor BamA [Bacteroidales bacterium]|nr:outer membrane protein assembly factor BamA [Bacteroidales bacterium]
MKKILIILPLLFLLGLPFTGSAQVVVGNQEYDIDYLTPKTYEIGGITFQGAENYDTRMVLLVAGLQVGDRIRVPGDKLATAVDRLWKQGLFEDVQIYVTRIQGDVIFFEIVLKSRPKMSMFKINGVKKSDNDKLKEEMNIATGDVVTENLLTTSRNRIRAFYLDKGYSNVSVTTEVEKDTIVAKNENRVNVIFNVKPGNRVKIDSLIIEGNSQISTNMLLQQMKNTHDVNYYKKFFFWTKGFWSRSKYQESKFNEDLESIITYYNENGFRDARVVWDTVYPATRIEDGKEVGEDRLIVKVRLHEGNKFVFRNITFSGNTIYPSDLLLKHLRIEKGDPYNRTLLETNLRYNPSGTDISSMYMDNGYLFFKAVPVEVGVENDSIDIEIRIVEGKQARIRNVSVEGNTMTNDRVILRELHTRPGDLFSRDAVMRSHRELTTLGYFKQETIQPDVKPNTNDGTVDVVYKVEEGNTSQIQLQGGYGNRMLIGQICLTLNNFSVRNIFNKKAWHPLPVGDGQKLSINAVTNGTYYYSFSGSFTEPWLGGRRPQSLSVSMYHHFISNGYFYKKSESQYGNLRISGAAVSFTKRLKWPDDYFIVAHTISYKHYNLNNYSLFRGTTFTNGKANDLSYGFMISRNSLDSPIYARSGSEVSVALYATPPYTAISGRDVENVTEQDKFNWTEYYKINVRGSWMLNLVGDLVLNAKTRFGWMGYYDKKIGLSPFGRYFVGGDGLQAYAYDGREIIPVRGYEDSRLSPDEGASIFTRYTLELRHPVIESSSATIWLLGFLEGGNSWYNVKDFQPFSVYKSAGVGVRVFMPMFGLIGVDWGYGFDGTGIGGSHVHFSIGQSMD